jgi:superfamily II DNA or RNA helicase
MKQRYRRRTSAPSDIPSPVYVPLNYDYYSRRLARDHSYVDRGMEGGERRWASGKLPPFPQVSTLLVTGSDDDVLEGETKSVLMGHPRWVSRGSELLIRGDGETSIVPRARDIYDAEFKGRYELQGVTDIGRPSLDLPWLRFSKNAVALKIVIVLNPTSPGTPECGVVAVWNGSEQAVESVGDEARDYAIFNAEWHPMVEGGLEEIRGVLANCGVAGLGRLSLHEYYELSKVSQDNPEIEDRLPRSWARTALPAWTVAAPPGPLFAGDLYPYQKDGFEWLEMVSSEGLGCILGDEMGLGTTVQVIALLCAEAARGRGPSLVIAPATILENWRREVEKFGPRLTVLKHRGAERTGFPSELRQHNLVITSYETAVRDLAMLSMVNWNLLVLDEAQAVKNPSAERTRAVRAIPRRVAIAVTGTPLQNCLADLWSLTSIAVPGLLGSLRQFRQYYGDSLSDAMDLESHVSPFLLRRTVAEVAKDLPERVDVPQVVEMGAIESAGYEAVRAEEEARAGGSPSIGALMHLRMYCAHPFVVNVESGDPAPFSAKYRRLVEIIEELAAVGEKALVFTSFTNMVDILVRDLQLRFGFYADFVDGRVPVEERQTRVDRFNTEKGPGVLVLKPVAGGTGLNIAGACHVIHYNLEWNPAIEDQATARAYRRGQTRPVFVHRLLYARTVEEVIDRVVQRKRRLMGTAVVGTDGTDVSREELLQAICISPAAKRGD